MEQFERTEMLLGKENMKRLHRAKVAVFGIGGVGGYVVEALARSGVGMLDLIDHDTVCLSNLNRQIIATHDTLGMYKVDAAKKRILQINPEAVVHVYRSFYLPDNADEFDLLKYDYIVDAIDTVTAKLELIRRAQSCGTPIISSMGTGNKMDPTAFEISDISKTSVCPLARTMRRELKKRGIEHLKVLYSREPAMHPIVTESYHCKQRNGFGEAGEDFVIPAETLMNQEKTQSVTVEEKNNRRSTPGSNAFVPSVAGLIIAGEVVKDLTDPGQWARI